MQPQPDERRVRQPVVAPGSQVGGDGPGGGRGDENHASRLLGPGALERHDPDDPLSLPEAEGFDLRIGPAPERFRFAVPSTATRLFHGDTAAEALFDRAIGRLERMGGRAVEIDYRPLHAAALMLYDDAFIARRYANLEPVYAELERTAG